MFGGACPAPALGFGAGSAAQGLAFQVVAQQAAGGFDQACSATIGAVGFIEAAVDAVGDDVGDAATVGADHGTTGCHGFQQHQPQRLRAGGEEEGIAAGVGPCQVVPGEIADEGGGGSLEVLLQLLAVGTIAHQGQPCIGKGLQHGADPFDLLLRGEAADVKQQRTTVVMAAEKPLAQLRAAQLGTEQLRVHTPLPQISVLNAFVAELLHHGGGGAQIQQGLVVGGLEHLPQEWLQHSQAVVLEVLGQVGVITRHQRDAFVLREPDAAETQHRRVHNVDQIGLKRIDRVGHRRARQGQFELGIERQRHRRHAD